MSSAYDPQMFNLDDMSTWPTDEQLEKAVAQNDAIAQVLLDMKRQSKSNPSSKPVSNLNPNGAGRLGIQALGVDQLLGFTLLLCLCKGEEGVNHTGFVANLIEVRLVDEVHEQALFGAVDRRKKRLDAIEQKRANSKPLEAAPGTFGVVYADPAWDYSPSNLAAYVVPQ